jgi:hypothetical protein
MSSFPTVLNAVPYWAGFAVIDEYRMIAVGGARALPGATYAMFHFLASYCQDLYSNICPLCGLTPPKTNRIITKLLLGREVVEVSLIYFPRVQNNSFSSSV